MLYYVDSFMSHFHSCESRLRYLTFSLGCSALFLTDWHLFWCPSAHDAFPFVFDFSHFRS